MEGDVHWRGALPSDSNQRRPGMVALPSSAAHAVGRAVELKRGGTAVPHCRPTSVRTSLSGRGYCGGIPESRVSPKRPRTRAACAQAATSPPRQHRRSCRATSKQLGTRSCLRRAGAPPSLCKSGGRPRRQGEWRSLPWRSRSRSVPAASMMRVDLQSRPHEARLDLVALSP